VIGLDFFPSGDQSELDLTLTMPPSTTLDATNAVSQKMELELRQYPEVRDLYSVIGQATVPGAIGTLSGTNQAQMTVLLVPRAERQRSSADLAEDACAPVAGWWTVAARDGLRHRTVGLAARRCAQIAAERCAEELRPQVQAYAEMVWRGRTPGDDLRERALRGPLAALEEEAHA